MRAELAAQARALIGLLVVLISFVPARVHGAAVAPLRVSYPAPTATQLPLWVAKEAKLFDKHGVAVDLVYVGSSSIAIAALFSGQLAVVAGGGVGGIASYLANQARMEAFLKALIESIHFIKTKRPEALSILSRYTRTTDPEALSITYSEYVQKVWPQIPDIQPEDLTAVLEQQAETNPKALEINPAELIHDALMENVLRSGFVKQVYR